MDADLARDQIAEALRTVAAQYPSRLVGTGTDALRRRPTPTTWSALEYATHVSDLLRVQHELVTATLDCREPRFGSMPPESRAVEQHDDQPDPVAVGRELGSAAESLAALFESLGGHDGQRTGRHQSVPTPELVSIGRRTVHELVHHLLDINRSIQPTPGSASG